MADSDPRRRQLSLTAVFVSLSLLCVAFALLRPSFAPLFFGSALIGIWVAMPVAGAAIALLIGCWRIGGIEGALCGGAVGGVAALMLFYVLGLILVFLHV
jgi:hypothetical protein